MYTELVFKTSISKKIAPENLAVLKYLFGGGDKPETLPAHPFFAKGRWESLGSCSSFYHHPEPCNSWVEADSISSIYIFSRSDLKNYDGEIDSFIDWVRPFLDEAPEQCIGWSWYEEETAPTLIYAKQQEAQQ